MLQQRAGVAGDSRGSVGCLTLPRQAGAGQDSAAQSSSGTNPSSRARVPFQQCLFARGPPEQGWTGGCSPSQHPVLCRDSTFPAGIRCGERNTVLSLSWAPPASKVPPAWESKMRRFYKTLKLLIKAVAVLSVSAFLIF